MAELALGERRQVVDLRGLRPAVGRRIVVGVLAVGRALLARVHRGLGELAVAVQGLDHAEDVAEGLRALCGQHERVRDVRPLRPGLARRDLIDHRTGVSGSSSGSPRSRRWQRSRESWDPLDNSSRLT